MNEKTIRILEFDRVLDKLAGFASCELGKELAAKLLPANEYGAVKVMQKETNDGLSLLLGKGSPPLGGIHDIRVSLKRAGKGSILNPGELLKISGVLRACRNLKRYSLNKDITNQDSKEDENQVISLINSLVTDRAVEEKISRAIISEDEIADSASSTLNNIRRQISRLLASIKDRLDGIVRSEKYKKFMQDAIVTLRDGRYVVPVKQEYRSEIAGIVHDSSSSGATLFIEPMAVVEANNEIKQLKIKEQSEIERILAELTGYVAGILVGLQTDVSVLARLDLIFAKAKLSVEYNCVSPQLNNGRQIDIRGARHPLLDRRDVVPIDFKIGDDCSIVVITGPNTGGKTVTLKTIGLFSLMMQSGLHIPAKEGSRMCVFEKIFADIGDEQSIEQSLSTFSSHMTNIVKILDEVNESSLVLLDELGAGTDPTEGAALAMAILERLYAAGCIAAATTHYSELKIYALTTNGVENASCEFDVETLRPTYRLLIGVPGKSNAFAISKKLGLDTQILKMAEEFLTREDIKFEDILSSMEKNLSQSEQERLAAERHRLEIENIKKELEEERSRLKQRRDSILREAKEEARRTLIEAKQEADEIVQSLRKVSTEQTQQERNRYVEEMRSRLRAKTNELEESLSEAVLPRSGYKESQKKFKPGDSVKIMSLNQKGTVLGIPDKNGEVLVQAGIMKINVHASNLIFVDEQEENIKKIKTGKTHMTAGKSVRPELDIRGSNLDEALLEVDKYLDDVSMAGLHEVTIIHGKGTGVLRKGIQKYLSTSSHVKSYRTGRYGEGEAGVTVVEL
jgi:DNA mismatch repair protein MutS2